MSTPSAPLPARVLSADPLGTLGKVVGVIAGTGAFLYLVGTCAMWERLAGAGMLQQEVIAQLPREQLAVAGGRELVLSSIAAAIFGIVLAVIHAVFRSLQRLAIASGIRARLARWMLQRPAVVMVLSAAASCAPVTPVETSSMVTLVLFLLVVYFGVRSVHRTVIGESHYFPKTRLPWIQVTAGVLAAVVLVSIARQSSFPDPFPLANVVLDDGQEQCGLYLGATPGGIVLGVRPEDFDSGGVCRGKRPPKTAIPRITQVQNLSITRVQNLSITEGPASSIEPPNSLLSRLGVPLECVSPVCQIGTHRKSALELFAATRKGLGSRTVASRE